MSAVVRRALLSMALVGGVAVAGDEWAAAASPDGAVTVATPCTAAEVAAARRVPETMLPNVRIAIQSRVLCRKGKLLFVAGKVGEPAPAGAPALFDRIVAGVRADRTAEGRPTTTTVAGRRVFANRQLKDGALAQTSFVEVDHDNIVLLLAMVEAGSGLSASEQAATVDRFVGSVRIGR